MTTNALTVRQVTSSSSSSLPVKKIKIKIKIKINVCVIHRNKSHTKAVMVVGSPPSPPAQPEAPNPTEERLTNR